MTTAWNRKLDSRIFSISVSVLLVNSDAIISNMYDKKQQTTDRLSMYLWAKIKYKEVVSKYW
jgi:hypothetical protein